MWELFLKCIDNGWHYIIRYKEGSIPSIADEYRSLKKIQKNYQEQKLDDGICWYDYVTDIDYNGHKINLAEYGEKQEIEIKKGNKKGEIKNIKTNFLFITNLPISKKNIKSLILPSTVSAEKVLEFYRLRWQVELVFKRYKSLIGLGNIPTKTKESGEVWLNGKMFLALLIEKYLGDIDFSPSWKIRKEPEYMEGDEISIIFNLYDDNPR